MYLGPQVSLYVSKKFKQILMEDPNYSKGNYNKALDEAFRKMDQSIKSESGAKQLSAIRTGKKVSDITNG